MNFLERARRALGATLQHLQAPRVPPCCGVCDYIGEYDYDGTDMFMCEHKGGPGQKMEAPFVQPELQPPVWCPKRNGIAGVMIQVPDSV